jgi:hypothetical protein
MRNLIPLTGKDIGSAAGAGFKPKIQREREKQ